MHITIPDITTAATTTKAMNVSDIYNNQSHMITEIRKMQAVLVPKWSSW